MNEYELVEYRNNLARLARAWRKELKAEGKSPGTILTWWRDSKRFMTGLNKLVSKYGYTVTDEFT